MNPTRTMRLDQYILGGVTIVVAVAALIALTWFGTNSAITAQRDQTSARITSSVTSQASAFALQINRQILAIDQTLQDMTRAWEADPAHFNLEARRAASLVLTGISRDMLLLDQRGIIRQSSVPETVGTNAADRDFFNYVRQFAVELDVPSHPMPFIGVAAIDPVMRQWHLNVARPLKAPDGTFSGAIAADYRVSAILDIFYEANIGTNGVVMLVGTEDGRLRAGFGQNTVEPNLPLADTPMMKAMEADSNGLWLGPSGTDAVRRVHGFRRVPGRDLAVIVALDEDEAMLPAALWNHDATIFAASITALLCITGSVLLIVLRQGRMRGLALAEERGLLAAANAELEAAKAYSFAKTEQLEATLAGMTDGIAMMDSEFHLMEWNARFSELAGIPSELLQIGMSMEDILRAQIEAGEFGIVDPEAEVARRMAILRSGRVGTIQRTKPVGRVLELRRNRLPDGGTVTLYADVTERRMAEDALHEARAMAEAANEAKSRFVAIVSHEIRTPLNALLNTIRLLEDGELGQSQRTLVALAAQSGEALAGLINDILEMSRFEAGQLTLRDSAFELRPLLEGALEMFGGQAGARDLELRLDVSADVPAQLFADAGRLRQVLLNLLSNAVKFARPGAVWVVVQREPPASAGHAAGLRIMVRDQGPVIQPDDRARLFRPFARIDRPDTAASAGTGLGLSICHHIVTLMGGDIGCDVWHADDGDTLGPAGNSFWLTLPASILVASQATGVSVPSLPVIPEALSLTAAMARRPLPRTRVLLVEDVPANRIITATLLRRCGHLVDLAETGEAAIRAVNQTPYDIVFMDIFMPGMGGIEATQRLRASMGPGRRIPIVALTGNNGPEDEAAFAAAGMNGVLGKPVALLDLLLALGRHVWSGHPAGASPDRFLPAPEQPDDLNHGRQDVMEEEQMPILAMDRLEELRANIPAETLEVLIESCLVDLEEMLPPFRRALESGLTREISTQAHTMAGVAGCYAMAALEARLRTIMLAVAGGDPKGLEGAFAETEAEFQRAAAALRDLLRNDQV